MEPDSKRLSRRLGGALFFAFIGLIVVGALLQQPTMHGNLYWFVRWPVWVTLLVAAPLIALRVVLWRRRRAARLEQSAPGSAEPPA